MPKQYGVEYPERPLMAVVSDLLNIPHFTTSNGGTVRSDFLQAVLVALSGEPAGRNKDELIAACVEAATRRPFDPRYLSPRGTVTNAALQLIVDGVTEHGLSASPAKDPRSSPDLADVIGEFDPGDIVDERTRL